MEYGRREPIKGESGREPTAFTMKSIKELLAEQTTGPAEAPTLRTPLPKTTLQQPPHMRGRAPMPAPVTKPALRASVAPKVEAEMTAPPMPLPKEALEALRPQSELAEPVEKPRSFLGRLIGG